MKNWGGWMIDEKKLIEKLDRLEKIASNYRPDVAHVCTNLLCEITDFINEQPKVGVWIPVEERLPKEYKCYIDEETGYYSESDNVLCCCKNEYNEFEYWIDYTIDGEWQTHEYFDGEKFYWQQLPALPEPYKGETE